MDFQGDKLQGNLVSRSNTIPVEVIYASRYSLFVKLSEEESMVRDRTIFDKLQVDIMGKNYEFNSCRLNESASKSYSHLCRY